MTFKSAPRTLGGIVFVLLLAQGLAALPAAAYPFRRTLELGDRGRDVIALEVRVAGWFPSEDQSSLNINRKFTGRTATAVRAFQSSHRLSPDGIAGASTFAALNNMEDADGSTTGFRWGQFKQNYNSGCSAKANAYAGSFDGGMGSPRRVKRFVRRLMWRLEALRSAAGGQTIGINSAFRSLAYNDCIGGAGSSQHLYGTAADQRMALVSNHDERRLGEATAFSGIGCYAQQTHNHFDIRVDNGALPSSQFWWWPKQNSSGQDLDDQSRPCYGETSTGSLVSSRGQIAPPELLTQSQIRAFASEGETANLGPAD